LAGCFFEGETILGIGGFAAYRGYLHLPWVIVAAYGETLLGDQLYFFLGRVYGQRFLKNRPYGQSRVVEAQGLLRRFQTSLMLLFRFLYGIRAITPFAIGMSGVSPRKFLFFNALGVSSGPCSSRAEDTPLAPSWKVSWETPKNMNGSFWA
jgi:membrane protein DedA with SNARE-associated domain